MENINDILIPPIIKRPEVLTVAINKYGYHNQIDMAIEEMAELIQALNKYKRAAYLGQGSWRGATNNVDAEMADVYIMMAQLGLIFNNSGLVQEIVDNRVDRLADMEGD